jgi:predicted ATP-grasp superfamily ATP-dependent carboligase
MVRAGDLFADADLCRISQATRVRHYPAGLAGVVGGPQAGAWMYTGALENHPSLIDAMARLRPLWGNPAAVLRRVRNPRLVAEALARNGLNCVSVELDPRPVPRDGTWLCKPRRSAGGSGIRFWTHQPRHTDRCRACYYQQFVDGAACSAVYVAARGRAVLLGITRQLIGQAWATGPFRYCGSVGPIQLSAAAVGNFAAIGDALAREFHLVGLFGVDAVVNSSGVWPVEVNPRYTASIEILERAAGVSAIALHAAACDQARLPSGGQPAGGPTSGKAILFAKSRLEISAAWTEMALEARHEGRPLMADIPQASSVVEAGWPLVTVLADAADEKTVLELLRQKAADVAASVQARAG